MCGSGKSQESRRPRPRVRWVASRALARAFPGRVGLLVALIALTGVVPAVFALLVARLVTLLPAAVGSGFDSPAGRHLVITLALMGGVLLVDEVVSSARTLVQADLYRRYEQYLLARVMTATLGASRLELFEDPAYAGKVARTAMLAESEPGDLVDGMSDKWTAQVQGLAGAILVGTVWPIAAVVLAAIWILVGRRLQADYQRLDPSGSAAHHRARYFWNLGLMPAWAKEVRIFGLVGWIADQCSRQWELVTGELAVARRIDNRTRTGLLILVIAANTVIVLWTVCQRRLKSDPFLLIEN